MRVCVVLVALVALAASSSAAADETCEGLCDKSSEWMLGFDDREPDEVRDCWDRIVGPEAVASGLRQANDEALVVSPARAATLMGIAQKVPVLQRLVRGIVCRHSAAADEGALSDELGLEPEMLVQLGTNGKRGAKPEDGEAGNAGYHGFEATPTVVTGGYIAPNLMMKQFLYQLKYGSVIAFILYSLAAGATVKLAGAYREAALR